MKTKALKTFKLIAMLEGISFLVLLVIAMPLKYWADWPIGVTVMGSLHGLLFVLYVCSLIYTAAALRWRLPRIIGGFIASLLPFGPFVFDSRISRRP